MGIYRAVKADEKSIVLVHEPETTESHTIEIRNPKASWTPTIEEGKRYTVSLSVTVQSGAPYVAPVVPLANTAEEERRAALSESTSDTEPPSAEEEVLEAVSHAGDSPEA